MDEKISYKCLDLHCGGEPARILYENAPEVSGTSMEEKRNNFMKNHDHVRELLLHEPRGYPCQNMNILYPSSIKDCVTGYIILEQNKIYPLFSGHNTICVATAVIELGIVKVNQETKSVEFNLEAPGGIIKIKAKVDKGQS